MSQKSTIVIGKNDHVRTAQTFLKTRKKEILTYCGDLFEYAGQQWEIVRPEDIRAAYWRFASQAKDAETGDRCMPTKHTAGNFLEALQAITNESGRQSIPFWRNGRDELPASEFVAFRNGLVHLPTRTVLRHTPDYFNLHALGYDFDPSAPEPHAFFRTINSMWPDDPESRDCLAEIIGYLIAGATDLQKIFGFFGAKRSGKGTLVRVLQQLAGPEACAGPTLSSLAGQFGLQNLIDKKLAVISDARLGGKVDKSAIAERLLAISGEDMISVPRKFRDDWCGQMSTRFLIISNEVLRLDDISGALASRFIVLHFPKSFYGKEDPALTSKLLKELPGILNWALKGYDRLRKRGYFIQPETGKAVLEELEALSSPISTFIKDRCRVAPGAQVECSELYQAWRDWCETQGREHPGTQQTFGRDIKAALPEVRTKQVMQTGERFRVYDGISLGNLHSITRDEVNCSVNKNGDLYRNSGECNADSRVKSSATEVLI